jgi:hypothetical protein
MTRIKRKSISDDIETDDEDRGMVVEKRPKYEPRAFAMAPPYGHLRTSSSSRRRNA